MNSLDSRQEKAIRNAKMAFKLIEKKENYKRLIDSVETHENKEKFVALCTEMGIGDPEANELWRLIQFECGKQAMGVCW